MKPLFFIALFFSGFTTYAQSAGLAIINDPDGYVNIRSGRITDSAVVSRLFNDQVFLCEFDNVLHHQIIKLTNYQICFYSVPLLACSLSIDSNNALKLPAPNPLAPMR